MNRDSVDNSDPLVEDVEKEPLLLKVLFMFVFYLLFLLIGYVLVAIGCVQILVRILSDSPHSELQKFGKQLGQYLGQITEYIAMSSDEKPYPFRPWPAGDKS